MSCIFSYFLKLFINWLCINFKFLRLSSILFLLQLIAKILYLALYWLLVKFSCRFLHLTCRQHRMLLWILLVDHRRLSQRTASYWCLLKYLLCFMTLVTLCLRVLICKCADLTPPLALTCKRLMAEDGCCPDPFNFFIFVAFDEWSVMLFGCSDWWLGYLYRFKLNPSVIGKFIILFY